MALTHHIKLSVVPQVTEELHISSLINRVSYALIFPVISCLLFPHL